MEMCLVFADLPYLFTPQGLLVMLKVAFGLGMVIFVHELGHFLVAKMCGVKCEKFYVGFDAPIKIGPIQLPRTLGKFQWGETEYGIGIIPLGGYVKMLGQDDNPANYQKEADRIKVGDSDEDTSSNTADQPISSDTTGGDSENVNESELQLDPRSYPAKPVPYRMSIISAGVIMNVIFAAIFATIAFRLGTTYTPCLIGSAMPGYSAWEAGLLPGDRIIQIGREGEANQQLRFHNDLQSKVLFSGANKELEFLIERGDEQIWFNLKPTNFIGSSSKDSPKIGVSPAYSNVLRGNVFDEQEENETENQPEESADQVQAGDQVIAVNGEGVEDGFLLQARLAQLSNQDVTLTVERQLEGPDEPIEKHDIVVPRRPLRRLGLIMRTGPITSVRHGSPAHDAGIQKGDLIKSVNGQPVVDPMILPKILSQLAGQVVDLELLRDGEQHQVQLRPSKPLSTRLYSFSQFMPVAAEAIGVVYSVSGQVVDVEPNSPAAKAGLQPQDEIVEVTFVPKNNDRQENRMERRQTGALDAVSISEESKNWPYVFSRMQYLRPQTTLNMKIRQQDGTTKTVNLAAVESDEWFWEDRGLIFETVSEPLQVQAWKTAAAMGLEQTWGDLTKVITVLRKIVTNEISPTKLGGPAMIVAAAGSEASQGIGRFLLFLTLLSANLAVINFLPIPVLDGGHMLFLAVEGITGKPLNEKLQFQATLVGLALILLLMVFVIGLDILRFAEWYL